MSRTPVDEALLRRLAEAVGPGHVLTDREAVEPFTHDETQGLAASPEAVVRPKDTAEVAAVLRLATEDGVAVTRAARGPASRAPPSRSRAASSSPSPA